MRAHLLVLLGSAASLGAACVRPAGASQTAPGQALYQSCAPCHGSQGQGNHALAAPAIAGLPAWYVETQLTNYRTGVRGAHPDDIEGLRMRPSSRQMKTREEVQLVSLFVAGMERARPEQELEGGDPAKGKELYGTCLACHGPDGKGNEAVHAPPLLGHSDWYLVTQLQKFKAGIRGTNPADTWGKTMQPMSMILADEQAMKDVVAYIQTLGT